MIATAHEHANNQSPPETVSNSPTASTAPDTPSAPQSPEETVTTSTGGNATPAADAAKPYSANEELAKLEAMSPHPSQDEMARRLSVKNDQLLKDLTAELALSDAQVTSMKTILDTREKQLARYREHLEAEPPW